MKSFIYILVAATAFVTVSCGKQGVDEKQLVIEYWSGLAKFVQSPEFKREAVGKKGNGLWMGVDRTEEVIAKYRKEFLEKSNLTEDTFGGICDKYEADPETQKAREEYVKATLK